MDAIQSLCRPEAQSIVCIEMHTTGEPTRIVIKGYPSLTGTLLQQRAQAKAQHDHIRRRVVLEPRGHADIYGAILRPETELTTSGDAHIGVLFIHNEGYSTMCGHATIALGRFLLDTHDLEIFPKRNDLQVDEAALTVDLCLHAPCGLVKVTVPTTPDGLRSDSSRPVSFISVPSFATGIDVPIEIPPQYRWPELAPGNKVVVSFAYGGAFTCLVSAREFGVELGGLRAPVSLDSFTLAARKLKQAVIADPSCEKYLRHPEEKDLDSLYTLMIVDKDLGERVDGSIGAETGLCYFADRQIDRSPTGSVVAARVALAYAKGELAVNQPWTYHSLVSNFSHGRGGFVGAVAEEDSKFQPADNIIGKPVRVRVHGHAYYTGYHIFVAETDDPLDDGFLFQDFGR
jgi:trans-L-3-hydroxyproline dehydratase